MKAWPVNSKATVPSLKILSPCNIHSFIRVLQPLLQLTRLFKTSFGNFIWCPIALLSPIFEPNIPEKSFGKLGTL
jgi:hypothetical protein